MKKSLLFADKIGTVSTSRILDFRLKDIAILETIIEYLIDNTLLDQLSTAAILIIEDTFEYDQIANRSSGSRLEFSLEPSSEYQNYNNTNTYNKDFDIGALGRISHISYKNIDVKWMQRIVYEAKLNFNNRYRFTSHAQLENLTLKNATAELNFRYGYSYLPNLRNNLSFYLYSGITMNASFRENQPTDYSSARLSIRLNASYNYYISPATQLVVSSELRYLDNEFQAGDFQPRISGELQFMLTHAIF